MTWILLSLAGVLVCFSFVVLFGAPYVPTLSKQARIALDTIDLQPGQLLLELGSGDGKILVAAAERGWRAVGYELNPILVLVSRWRTRRYRRQVRVVWGNLWRSKTWPRTADGIFVFILQKHMPKLDTTIIEWRRETRPTKPLRLVSFAFTVPGKKPIAQHKSGVYLYEYK